MASVTWEIFKRQMMRSHVVPARHLQLIYMDRKGGAERIISND